jgi:hypothetical protein
MYSRLASWADLIIVLSSDKKTMFLCGDNSGGYLPGPQRKINEFVPVELLRPLPYFTSIEAVRAGVDEDGKPRLYLLISDLEKQDVFYYDRKYDRQQHDPKQPMTFVAVTECLVGTVVAFTEYGRYLAVLNNRGELFVNQACVEEYKPFIAAKLAGVFQQIKYPTDFGKISHLEFSDRCLFLGTDRGVILAIKIISDLSQEFDKETKIPKRPDGWYLLKGKPAGPITTLQAQTTKVVVLYKNGTSFTNDGSILAGAQTGKAVGYSSLGHLFLDADGVLSASGSMASLLSATPIAPGTPASTYALAAVIKKGSFTSLQLASEHDFIAILVRAPGRSLDLYLTGKSRFIGMQAGTFTKIEFSHPDNKITQSPQHIPIFALPTMAQTGAAAASSSPRAPSPPIAPSSYRPHFEMPPEYVGWGAPLTYEGGAAAASSARCETQFTTWSSTGAAARAESPSPAFDVDGLSTEHSIALWDDAVAVVANSARTELFIFGNEFPTQILGREVPEVRRYLRFDFTQHGVIHSIYAATNAQNVKNLFILLETKRGQFLLAMEAGLNDYFIVPELGLPALAPDLPFKTIVTFDTNFIQSMSINRNNIVCLSVDNTLYVNQHLAQFLAVDITSLPKSPLYAVAQLSYDAMSVQGAIIHAALNANYLFFVLKEGLTIYEYPLTKSVMLKHYKTGSSSTVKNLQANHLGAYALLADGAIYSTLSNTTMNQGYYLSAESLTKVRAPNFFKPSHGMVDMAGVANYRIALMNTGALLANEGTAKKFPTLEFKRLKDQAPVEAAAAAADTTNENMLPNNSYFYQFPLEETCEAYGQFKYIHFSREKEFIAVLAIKEGAGAISAQHILIHSAVPLSSVTLGLTSFDTQTTGITGWLELIINNQAERARFIEIIKEKIYESAVIAADPAYFSVGPSGVMWLDAQKHLLVSGERATEICMGRALPMITESVSCRGFIGPVNTMLDLALGQNYMVALFQEPQNKRFARITGDFESAPLTSWCQADEGRWWHALF